MRIDTPSRQQKVDMTRKWIFEKGLSVKSAAVERVLAPESLVPTRVLDQFSFPQHLTDLDFLRMHFLLACFHSISISFPCLCPIYFMSSNSGFGRHSLHI